MCRRTYFFVLAVVCGFSVRGYCSDVLEVDWHGGGSPPSEEWIIEPFRPNGQDIISFSGPTEVYSNACYAEMYYGGPPTLTIDHNNKSVELWFEPTEPFFCYDIVIPVCGLEGQFGPLEEGDWIFFSSPFPEPWPPDEPPPDLPYPIFTIEFHVGLSLRLVSPNGGESLLAGSTHTVSWEDIRDGGSCSGFYVVGYSIDDGQNWHLDFSFVTGSCEFEWTVPTIVSDQVVVGVFDLADLTFYGISDESFSISRCGDELPGDLNDDCYVNSYDYALFALLYDDGLAGISELAELVDGWLSCGDSSNPLCLD